MWGRLYYLTGRPKQGAITTVEAYRNVGFFDPTKHWGSGSEAEAWKKGSESRIFFTTHGFDGTIPNETNNFEYKECEPCKEKYDQNKRLTISLRLKPTRAEERFVLITDIDWRGEVITREKDKNENKR